MPTSPLGCKIHEGRYFVLAYFCISSTLHSAWHKASPQIIVEWMKAVLSWYHTYFKEFCLTELVTESLTCSLLSVTKFAFSLCAKILVFALCPVFLVHSWFSIWSFQGLETQFQCLPTILSIFKGLAINIFSIQFHMVYLAPKFPQPLLWHLFPF